MLPYCTLMIPKLFPLYCSQNKLSDNNRNMNKNVVMGILQTMQLHRLPGGGFFHILLGNFSLGKDMLLSNFGQRKVIFW